MKKYKILLSLFIALFFGGSSFSQKKGVEDNKWTGTISYKSIFRQTGSDSSSRQMKTEWNNNSESVVTANFQNNGGHTTRVEKTNNWLKTIFEVNPKNIQVENRTTNILCNCIDTSDVKVEIVNEGQGRTQKYWVSCIAASCTGNTTTIYSNTSLQRAGLPVQNQTTKTDCGEVLVNITEQPLGKDPTHLVGTTVERRTGNGGGQWETTISWNLRKACPPWNDPQTRLNNVDSRIKVAALRFIKRVHDELCIRIKVISGLRTFDEQDKLYAIGRPPPPKKVTNAKGGQSFHNHGLAIDICIVDDNGKLDFKAEIPPEVVKIGKEEGFTWGGDWSNFKDYPHFEMTFGQKIK